MSIFSTDKENELREQLVNFITRIESINEESRNIIKELSDTLSFYENKYDSFYKNKINELFLNDEIIWNSTNIIKSSWEFLNVAVQSLNSADISLLDKNDLYPKLIEVISTMILNYYMITSRVDYLIK